MTSAESANKTQETVERLRQRPFKLFLVQHAHIDIGYTHRQEVIEEFQRQFIQQAVELATSPRQAERPDHLKFRFTCEGFWAVEKFLAQASARERESFEECLRSGLLELSATYFHMSELLDEGHLRDTLRPASDYARSIGYDLDYAGAFDINGFSWGYCDALAEAGVRRLSTCINTHHGGRPFNKRNVPFIWRGPAGGRLLVWEGQTYHKANLYGLVPLTDSASGPAFPVGDLSMAEDKLLGKIGEFLDEGYELDFFPIFAGGLYTDNSPPTDVICEHLAAWNDAYGDVCQIQTATMRDFFDHLEAHAGDIPEYTGDWPDWWSDGVGSTPDATQLFLNAQRTTREIEALDPDGSVVAEQERADIARLLFHYAEHTWGHSHCVEFPWLFLSQQMTARKVEYAIAADRTACSALDRVLRARGMADFTAQQPMEFRAVNVSGCRQNTLAHVQLDFWELSELEQGLEVVDDEGNVIANQPTRTTRGASLAVMLDLDHLESKNLHVRRSRGGAGYALAAGSGREIGTSHFETENLRLEWKKGNSGLHTLFDKQSGRNLCSEEAGLLTPHYQVFPAGDLGPARVRAKAGIAKEKPADERDRGSLEGVDLLEDGPLFAKLLFRYKVRGASLYHVEVVVPRQGRWISAAALMNKDNVWDPEGMYLGFPLQMADGQWFLDRPGGPVRPGVDQLPNTCRDYYMVQGGAIHSDGRLGVGVSMRDTPLVHLGGLNLWDYRTEGTPEGTLYSWQTNNKWETNFKGSCGGFYGFRYVIEAGEHLARPHEAIGHLRASNHDLLVFRTNR